ncbi:MAG: hypothetical protein RL447_603, partial [Bacteroidota bacterium]
MYRFLLIALLFFSHSIAISQIKLFPSHWFVGFKKTELNLIIHRASIGNYTQASISYPGVRLIKVRKADSPNYLFLDLQIASTTKPGRFSITLTGPDTDPILINYELKSRSKENGVTRIQGVHASDFIYLI